MNKIKITRSKKLQTVVLIILLCAFYMTNSAPETPIVEVTEFNTADIQSQPSEELQSAIDDTMSGFNLGFMMKGDGIYELSSPQLNMRFSDNRVLLHFPDYKSQISENLEESPQIVGYSLVALEFVDSNPVQPIEYYTYVLVH